MYLLLLVYVDDLLLATNAPALMNKTKQWLKSEFEMQDLGEPIGRVLRLSAIGSLSSWSYCRGNTYKIALSNSICMRHMVYQHQLLLE